MLDQYFGTKELYEVVLRAKTPMNFGSRYIEADEPILYFENINVSTLSEQNRPIMARGGWSNFPRVIWEDRSEVRFMLSEGVMSSISMSVLLNAKVTEKKAADKLLVPKREGPMNIDENNGCMLLEHWPVDWPQKKTFIYEYERDVAQKKVYGKKVQGERNPLGIPTIELFEDKELTIPADDTKNYIIDYYYEYDDESLIYSVNKERFNGLFTLEGKFYSKDENEGLNYTNLIYMPKVRVVSDINLRLGERADPTTSVFNIIGLPETVVGHKQGMILEITRLNSNIDDKEE